MNYNLTDEEINFVNRALEEFNNKAVGPDNYQLLNIVEYDSEEKIIAGILGGPIGAGCTWTFYGWTKNTAGLELDQNCLRLRKMKRFVAVVIRFMWTQ